MFQHAINFSFISAFPYLAQVNTSLATNVLMLIQFILMHVLTFYLILYQIYYQLFCVQNHKIEIVKKCVLL